MRYLSGVILGIFLGVSQASGVVIINELDSDTPTLPVNDSLEFIELYNTGSSSVDLAAGGYVLVFYNGSNDASYFALNLTGTIPAAGYYVAGSSLVTNVSADTWSTGSQGLLQNGADAVALFSGTTANAFSRTPVTSIPGGAMLVDAVVYDTADPDDAGLLAALTPGQPQVNESANGNSANESIQRIPNGAGGAFNTGSFQALPPTPGTSNGTPAVPTDVANIAVARALGTGLVRITGTVTVTVGTNGLDGNRHQLYVQDYSGLDGQSALLIDDAPFNLAVPYNPGNLIQNLTGNLTTFRGMLELQPTTTATSAGSSTIPAPLPVDSRLIDFENIEAELIQVDGADILDGSRTVTWVADKNYVLEGPFNHLIGILRIEDAVNAAGAALPMDPFNVVGIAVEYSSNPQPYQILPRSTSDIDVAPATPSAPVSHVDFWQIYR